MPSAPDLSSFRADFPALARRRGGRPPIYLNNACTTLRPTPVIAAVTRYYERFPTCGGGRAEGPIHSWFVGELKAEEAAARERVRALLGAERTEEIVWTRNTTEAINLVAHGLALAPGDEVLGSENEHNSNLVPWLELERRLRARAGDDDLVVRRFFDLAADGSFDVDRALDAITPRTKVLAISHASNLDGTCIPDDDLRALARRVHDLGGVVVLDAAQTVPHRPVDVRALDVDFLAFSLHKMCGPAGMGVLYGRYGQLASLAPFIAGGDTVADAWQDRVEYKPPPSASRAGSRTTRACSAPGPRSTTSPTTSASRRSARTTRRCRPTCASGSNASSASTSGCSGRTTPTCRGGVVTMASSLGAVINAIERRADEEHNVMLRKGMFCTNAYLHRRFDRAGTAKNNLRASTYLYNTEAECDVLCRIVEEVVKDPMAYLDDE